MTGIELRESASRCILYPELGGSILALELAGRPVLRTAPPDCHDIEKVACFPLLPFANRIANGRFTIGDTAVQLPPDPLTPPHAHHGHGWRSAWTLVERGPDWATLRLVHDADAWPWRYRAEQRFRLLPGGLTIEIAVLNDDATPMPIGVGIHPFFDRSADSALVVSAAGRWEVDAEGIPTRFVPDVPLEASGATPIDRLAGVDTFFAGVAPNLDLRIEGGTGPLRLTASSAEGFHLYVPAGERFFCVEPVSHAPNSFARGPIAPAHRLDAGTERRWRFAIRLG